MKSWRKQVSFEEWFWQFTSKMTLVYSLKCCHLVTRSMYEICNSKILKDGSNRASGESVDPNCPIKYCRIIGWQENKETKNKKIFKSWPQSWSMRNIRIRNWIWYFSISSKQTPSSKKSKSKYFIWIWFGFESSTNEGPERNFEKTKQCWKTTKLGIYSGKEIDNETRFFSWFSFTTLHPIQRKGIQRIRPTRVQFNNFTYKLYITKTMYLHSKN